jgi:formylmethanofuran dehydrogenase subunit E
MRNRRLRIAVSVLGLVGSISLVVVPAACAHTGDWAAGAAQGNVVVDTDMGLDDVRSIFALLADSTVDIRAIVTVAGSASLGKGTDNLIGLLEDAGAEAVDVLTGAENPELVSPPWRQTASQLGGAVFPPPRRMTAAEAFPTAMADLLGRGDMIEYVALGPLTNLQKLAETHPGAFDNIRTVWLPAVVRGGHVGDWNLTSDRNAAEYVLDHAGRVVIIDISDCSGGDAIATLSSVTGDSPSAEWIEQSLSHLGRDSGHVRFYDEFAVAGFSRPDFLVFDDIAYAVAMDDQLGFELIPRSDGHVQVAKLVDCDGALQTLKGLWERGPVHRHTARVEDTVGEEDLLRTFHGHLGPYVVLGYRMGRLALDRLHSAGHFGISAEVHTPLDPPCSCLIDGVQIGSGCTLGKRNIEVHEAPEPAWAVFTDDRGEKITIRLRDGIPALVSELVDSKGVEAAGHEFHKMDPDSLFTTEGPAQ